MCDFIAPLTALFTGGGAAAAGGATAAATAGAGLKGLGTLLAVGGSLYQGYTAYQSAKEQEAYIEQQKNDELRLNATKDQRERLRFQAAIAQQSAELAGRGVQLDSPTAVFLGRSAAREMSFNSQSIRSTGQSRQTELSAQVRTTRARGRQALFSGGLSAAGALLNRQPDDWPELLV